MLLTLNASYYIVNMGPYVWDLHVIKLNFLGVYRLVSFKFWQSLGNMWKHLSTTQSHLP